MVLADPLPSRFRPTPLPPHTLERQPVRCLLERLMPGLVGQAGSIDHDDPVRLLLLCAPAGFGKTTALAQLARAAQARGVRIAWLDCDEGDRVPQGLRTSLMQAVAHTGFEPPDLASLVSADTPLWIVLDRFERADSAASCALLEQLLGQAGRSLRLLLASRQPPGLPLTQLLLRGVARQIDAGSLRFSDAEARQLLQAVVSADHLEAVVRQAAGWPFALQLSRLRAQADPAPSGPGPAPLPWPRHQIFDYLTREVVTPLPARLRDFLTDVAVLDCVEPGVADALRQQSDSLALISQLTDLHPAVRLDEGCRSARLHPLLREHLQDRLRRTQPGRAERLHQRAARHLATQGQLQPAVRHALEGGQPGLAAELIEQAGGLLLCSEGVERSRQLLQALPAQVLQAHPRLRLMQLMLQLLEGPSDGAVAEFRRVSRLALAAPSQLGPDDPMGRDLMLAQAGLLLAQSHHNLQFSPWAALERLRAYARSLRMDDARPLLVSLAFDIFFLHRYGPAERCERRVREIEALTAQGWGQGNSPWIQSYQARNALARGQLQQAESLLSTGPGQDRPFQHGQQQSLVRLSLSLRGQIAYLRGDLDGAMTHWRALLPPRAGDPLEVLQGCCVELARCEFHSGHLPQALQRLRSARGFAQDEALRPLELLIDLTEVELQLRQGEIEQATSLARAAGLTDLARPLPGSAPLPWVSQESLARARWRWHLAQGAMTQAADIARELLCEAGRTGQVLSALRARCLLAVAHDLEGRTDAARNALEEALQQRPPQEAWQVWLELGPELPSLLRRWLEARRPAHPHPADGFARQVLDLWERRFQHCAAPGARQQLTPRETDVLFELSKSHSTKQIARALDLSPETIKHHLKNLYQKLCVGSRAEALMEARRRAWIP